MEIIGLIAEYNPFHNGHLYQIKKIKEKYPNSILILVLNGYFLERGDISIISKEDKTKIALDNGIDIVIELPVVFGTQSGDIFAYNSIKLLNELKIDRLVFGSESNNLNLLNKVVDLELKDDFDAKLKEYLDKGLNYPTAMVKALDIDEDIKNPNDLLGISYIKAIRKINPNIKVDTIKRTTDYHDTKSNAKIVSATNIREKLKAGIDITPYIPKDTYKYIKNVDLNDLFNLLKFKILTDKDLSIYLDVDEGIEYRILKSIKISENIEDLISLIKTKRYTYNKIKRMLIHILLGLTKQDNKILKLDYLKILGITTTGEKHLKNIRKDITLPKKPPKDSLIYKYELKASYLYKEATKKDLNNFDNKNIPIIKD